LLVQRLAPVMREVVGVEQHRPAVELARQRVAGREDVAIIHGPFLGVDLAVRSFDLITFVAALHHMPLRQALARARELLAPGGELIIVGLAKEGLLDRTLLGLVRIPLARLAGKINNERSDVPVPTTEPRQSAAEIRDAARSELPGSTMSYGLYFRYLLRWHKPAEQQS
jgi:SAM-dependent methyltransferase